jgi:diketogulonate reductase-like aldo/keto reductase
MQLKTFALVGFGTGGLVGPVCYDSVTAALKAGFRRFDTAETELWYDQKAVAAALETFFVTENIRGHDTAISKWPPDIHVSTKIPPWELTSSSNIRRCASQSRTLLLGFCDEPDQSPSPLDTYYIHAPNCKLWEGWHPRCTDPPPILSLREAWLAMEAVVGLDKTARRIGLSNITPDQLNDIIQFVLERKSGGTADASPRLPDVIQSYADPLHPSLELRTICRHHGIEFVSHSTLGFRHILKQKSTDNPVLNHRVVRDISRKYGKSEILIVLTWALQCGMGVIPRSSNVSHINELSLLLSESFLLSDEEVQLISSITDM